MKEQNTIVVERQAVTGQFMAMESLIKNHVKSIAELKFELKETREMFEDSFINDPVYREKADVVKTANKARLALRKTIATQPSVALLAQKIKDMRFDLAEQKRTLSDLLLDYKEQSHATQLELFDGQIVQIVQIAKVVRTK